MAITQGPFPRVRLKFRAGIPGRDGETSPETLEARQFVAEKAIEVGENAQQVAEDRIVVEAAVVQTASDRNQTGLDRTATAADRVQTGIDRAMADAARDDAQLIAGVREFQDLAALLANTTLNYVSGAARVFAGDILRVRQEGFSYRVVASGSSDYDLATAGGVRLYLLSDSAGHYNFAGMNPAANGVTDDYPKLKRLLDRPQAGGTSWYRSILPIYLPMGRQYYMGSSIELKRSVHIYGDGSGMRTDAAPELIFPSNTIGITVNRYNTLDGGKEAVPTTGADASTLEGFNLRSTVGSDKTKHGLWLRARATIKRMRIQGFSGNGLNVVAAAGASDPAEEGNANNFFVEMVSLLANGGSGAYIRGADANSGTLIGIDASGNGRSGIEDRSFLGNTHIGHHVAGNGVATAGANTSSQSSFVTHSGNRYAAHWTATPAQLVETEPGTDTNVWVLYGAGGTHPTIPAWTSGSAEGTYFPAFGYWATNLNARNLFAGCYWESGSSGNVFLGPSEIIGGSIGWAMTGDWFRKSSLGLLTVNSVNFSGNGSAARFQAISDVIGAAFTFSHSNEPVSNYWALQYVSGNWLMRNTNSAARDAFGISSANTTQAFGRASAVPYTMYATALGIGGRLHRGSATIPASGEVARGEIIWNQSASAAGKAGWICTTGGTVGSTAVLKPFGSIDA